jgi:predicted MFS family arabinose efflux permease
MSVIESLTAGAAARARAKRGLSSSPALVLFLCVFTSQAGILVLSPILVEVAHDLGVSTAAAGQLRIFAAPVAAVVAILITRSASRLPLRTLLGAGAALVGVGSLASAASPSFIVLALAQVPLWIGVATLVAGGIGAAGSWSAPDDRGRLIAHALAGAPAAWVIGMPVIGLVTETSWRLAFLAVPLPAAILTGVVLVAARSDRADDGAQASLIRLLREPRARRWAIAELAAMSSWAGMLVFSGVLFIETYGASTRLTGLLLATLAVAYLVGNAVGGRIHSDCLRRTLARANVLAGVAVALTWIVTPNLIVTLVLFSLASVFAAARTVAGTAYGFSVAGPRTLEVGAARAASTHVGYLLGSLLGGLALATGGEAAVGAAFGLLFLASALPYVTAWRVRCGVSAVGLS